MKFTKTEIKIQITKNLRKYFVLILSCSIFQEVVQPQATAVEEAKFHLSNSISIGKFIDLYSIPLTDRGLFFEKSKSKLIVETQLFDVNWKKSKLEQIQIFPDVEIKKLSLTQDGQVLAISHDKNKCYLLSLCKGRISKILVPYDLEPDEETLLAKNGSNIAIVDGVFSYVYFNGKWNKHRLVSGITNSILLGKNCLYLGYSQTQHKLGCLKRLSFADKREEILLNGETIVDMALESSGKLWAIVDQRVSYGNCIISVCENSSPKLEIFAEKPQISIKTDKNSIKWPFPISKFQKMALDKDNNLIFATNNCVFRKSGDGIVRLTPTLSKSENVRSLAITSTVNQIGLCRDDKCELYELQR